MADSWASSRRAIWRRWTRFGGAREEHAPAVDQAEADGGGQMAQVMALVAGDSWLEKGYNLWGLGDHRHGIEVEGVEALVSVTLTTTLLTTAAQGGLGSAPDRRTRGAHPHLSRSSAPPSLVVRSGHTVLAVLLEQDHGEQAGTRPAARRRVEGRRRLADRLAAPTGELLAHVLHDLLLARDPRRAWRARSSRSTGTMSVPGSRSAPAAGGRERVCALAFCG
jgi:hypothetical protein